LRIYTLSFRIMYCCTPIRPAEEDRCGNNGVSVHGVEYCQMYTKNYKNYKVLNLAKMASIFTPLTGKWKSGLV